MSNMKEIIKQFFVFSMGSTTPTIGKSMLDFESLYEQFIKHQPIGEAEQAIIGEIYNRARFGYEKYKTTTDREDYTPQQWAKNAQEEALDMAIYLTKLI